jgi:hypothetical protein
MGVFFSMFFVFCLSAQQKVFTGSLEGVREKFHVLGTFDIVTPPRVLTRLPNLRGFLRRYLFWVSGFSIVLFRVVFASDAKLAQWCIMSEFLHVVLVRFCTSPLVLTN